MAENAKVQFPFLDKEHVPNKSRIFHRKTFRAVTLAIYSSFLFKINFIQTKTSNIQTKTNASSKELRFKNMYSMPNN